MAEHHKIRAASWLRRLSRCSLAGAVCAGLASLAIAQCMALDRLGHHGAACVRAVSLCHSLHAAGAQAGTALAWCGGLTLALLLLPFTLCVLDGQISGFQRRIVTLS